MNEVEKIKDILSTLIWEIQDICTSTRVDEIHWHRLNQLSKKITEIDSKDLTTTENKSKGEG